MKTVQAIISVKITTGDDKSNTELQALIQNAMDSAADGIETTPNAEDVSVGVEFLQGKIVEESEFTLDSRTEDKDGTGY